MSFESILFAFCTINFRVFRQLSGRTGAFLVRFDTNLFQAANRLFFAGEDCKNGPFQRKTKSFMSELTAFVGEWLYADYPKVWPFPIKSLAAQEKTDPSAPQGNSYGLVEARLMPAKSRRFCYSYGSTGQFTHVAKLSVGCGQTFG
jgi:hypothetical protein